MNHPHRGSRRLALRQPLVIRDPDGLDGTSDSETDKRHVRCPHCASTASRRTTVLEHRPCGCVAFADAFTAGYVHRCPKCGADPDSLAGDLVTVAEPYACSHCERLFDEPAPRAAPTPTLVARVN